MPEFIISKILSGGGSSAPDSMLVVHPMLAYSQPRSFLVAVARFVPNRQLLIILFRSELIHCVA
jgi:hypothetical protein